MVCSRGRFRTFMDVCRSRRYAFDPSYPGLSNELSVKPLLKFCTVGVHPGFNTHLMHHSGSEEVLGALIYECAKLKYILRSMKYMYIRRSACFLCFRRWPNTMFLNSHCATNCLPKPLKTLHRLLPFPCPPNAPLLCVVKRCSARRVNSVWKVWLTFFAFWGHFKKHYTCAPSVFP